MSATHGCTGGSLPQPLGRREHAGVGSIMSDFDFSYCPEPENEKALLAMALMREGRSLSHSGYAFLSYYRVLEAALPDGRKRGEWIDRKIPTLTGYFAKPAVEKLLADGIADV